MESIDKATAKEVIEDALRGIGTPHGRGMVTGLCGAFHMCGLLSTEEWEDYLECTPVESDCIETGEAHEIVSLH